MRIACPACEAEYDFPVELLVDSEVWLRCTACGMELVLGADGARHPGARVVRRRAAAAAAPTPPPAQPPPAPPVPSAAPPATPAPSAAPATPPPAPNGRSASADGDGPAPSGLLGYLLVGGRAPVPFRRRRRVVVVTRPGAASPSPGARLISLPANFGKSPAGRVTVESTWSVPPEVGPPRPLRRPRVHSRRPGSAARPARPSRRRVAALVLSVAGAIAAVWALRDRPAAPPAPPAPAPVTAYAPAAPPAPPVSPLAPADPESASGLVVETVRVDPLPEAGAAVLQGYVHNGTTQVQRDLRIEAILVVDDRPRRRRELLCCDAFPAETADAVARDPQHAHFRRHLPGPDQTRLEPGEEQVFSVVFPRLTPELVGGALSARVRLMDAAPEEAR